MLLRQIEYANDSNGEKGILEVKIYYPASTGLHEGEWVCKYSISFPGEIETGETYGIDAVQALLLCIRKIDALMKYYQNAHKIKLTWLGIADLGFST